MGVDISHHPGVHGAGVLAEIGKGLLRQVDTRGYRRSLTLLHELDGHTARPDILHQVVEALECGLRPIRGFVLADITGTAEYLVSFFAIALVLIARGYLALARYALSNRERSPRRRARRYSG